MPTSQKNTPSKPVFNPNAPLFSQDSNFLEPGFQQKLSFPPNVHNNIENGFGFNNNNKNYFQDPQTGNPGTNFFNAPLFPQNYQVDQSSGNFFFKQNDLSNFDGNQNSDVIPPGLFNFLSQNGQSSNSSNDILNNFNSIQNQQAQKNTRSLYVETKTQPKQDSQSFIKEEDEPIDTPENLSSLKSIQDENAMLRPERAKSKGQNNLYSAVLSGKFKETTIINSPALNKIHNQYFSEISNPGSGINTPDVNTPLYHNSRSEFLDSQETGNYEGIEEINDNFRLEEFRGNFVEFAKTFNGSR